MTLEDAASDEERRKFFCILSVDAMLELAHRNLRDEQLREMLVKVDSIDIPDELHARANFLEQAYLEERGISHSRVLGLGTPTALAVQVLTKGWRLDSVDAIRFLNKAHASNLRHADVTIAQWRRAGEI